ncbi:MAG TPA: GNAT family N-acetyltransferase [Gemmatimonadaceae bacterium]|nr:GNAT family N-acetyltransferase [Gemmatimonadaceae bacterium]
MESTLEIRAIEAADLPVIAQIHMLAFPGAAMTALGREAVRRYYQWQLEGPHDLYATLAVVDGKTAGFSFAGHFRGHLIGYLRRNRAYLLFNTLRRPWLLANPLFLDRLKFGLTTVRRKLGKPVPRRDTSEAKRFGILSVAVDPTFQGHGVGHALMEDAEQEARRLGVPRMSLTVHPENEQAVRFYEHQGWYRALDARGRWIGHMQKDLP